MTSEAWFPSRIPVRTLFHRQPIQPDRKRITTPGIQGEADGFDALEGDLTFGGALPLGVARQRNGHGHPEPARLAEGRIVELGCILDKLEFDLAAAPQHPFSARCFLILAGPVTVLLSAFACLGLAATVDCFVATYPQLLKGVLAPIAYGREAVGVFFATIQTAPVEAYGTLAAKWQAFNMLPIMGFAGGHLVMQFFPKGESTKWQKILETSMTLIAVPTIGCWGVAIVSYFWYNH